MMAVHVVTIAAAAVLALPLVLMLLMDHFDDTRAFTVRWCDQNGEWHWTPEDGHFTYREARSVMHSFDRQRLRSNVYRDGS